VPVFLRLARAAAGATSHAELLAELRAALRLALGAERVDLLDPADGDRAEGVRLRLAWGGAERLVAVVELDEPDAADLPLARALADQATAGLARLDAERRSAHAGALVRAARALNASADLRDVLSTLAREAARALAADVAGVYLGGADGRLVATAGHDVPNEWHGRELAPGEGAAGTAVALGQAFAAAHDDRDFAAPVHTALAVPMTWSGGGHGALTVGWTAAHPAGDDERDALVAIADLATFACHNAETYEQVQRAARTDALTGLLNHGALQVRVREEIARARRDRTALTCAIVDLDDFKRVNDVHGHQAGDELLRRVAAALQQQLRPYDHVARYGGDEFVLLLPGSDEGDARQIAERVRDAVAARISGEPEPELAGACSIGVAAWREPLDADSLLDHADRALLLAKRTGKGRVAVANPDVERELALLEAEAGSPAAVQALAAAIEERDAYTHAHSEEVVHLVRGVAMILGLAADQVERIAHAALLHDVGKLAVPHEILHKPGPLDRGEWEVVAEHPIAGERVLLRIPTLAPLAPIVRHEHEHWDGTGYPDRLHGRNIPIGSRIILACDAYLAMITDRPYRPALPTDGAVAELRRGAGAEFDPEVVEALLDLLGHAAPVVPDRADGVRLPVRHAQVPPARARRRGAA
jgi:diguanylate cyclase (GGDEF)-like protein